MDKALKFAVGLPALLFIVIGVGWLVAPAVVASEFGMPLLEGLGLSTQIGDLGAFFTAAGLMVLLGLWTGNKTWLLAPALLLGFTAIFRTLAWALHSASFAGPQIAIEVVLTVLLLVVANRASDYVSGQPR